MSQFSRYLKLRKGDRHMYTYLQYAMRGACLELLQVSMRTQKKGLTLTRHWWGRQRILHLASICSLGKGSQIPWHLNQDLENEWQFTKWKNGGRRDAHHVHSVVILAGRVVSVYVAKSYDAIMGKWLKKMNLKTFLIIKG